jgi:hypothetical protein
MPSAAVTIFSQRISEKYRDISSQITGKHRQIDHHQSHRQTCTGPTSSKNHTSPSSIYILLVRLKMLASTRQKEARK